MFTKINSNQFLSALHGFLGNQIRYGCNNILWCNILEIENNLKSLFSTIISEGVGQYNYYITYG